MPRRARIVLPGVAAHVIQRGNNRQACFYCDDDYLFYLHHLEEQAVKHGCTVHAYCLMTNHVHLLLTPETKTSISQLMKGLGQRYVQYVNRTYQRSGTLWEGRFRSCFASEDNYVLACYRYIELNPVRAKLVEHPAEYRWSSYRFNAQSEASRLLTPHQLFESLGISDDERKARYRDLFRNNLEPGMVEQIRSATNGNYALGSEKFKTQVAEALGRRVSKCAGGRKPMEA